MKEKTPWVYYRANKNAWYWSPSKHSKKEYGPFQTSKEAHAAMEANYVC